VIGFLLDENVSPEIKKQLIKRNPALLVYSIGDGVAPRKSTLDPEILVWIENEGCLLATYNRDSMPIHLRDHLAQGRHVPGILELNLDMSIGEVIEQLLLIAGASLPDEFQDRIEYLPLR
jgi:hypothetical protein